MGRDAEELSHFPLGLAGIEQLMGMGDLLGSQGPWTAHMQAALLGSVHARLRPLTDQIPLKLGQRPHDMKHQLAATGGRVDPISEADKPGLLLA